MSKRDDGGPAFVCPGHEYWSGMSLRDWFAGQALANEYAQGDHPDKVAQWAYQIADAMLEARK